MCDQVNEENSAMKRLFGVGNFVLFFGRFSRPDHFVLQLYIIRRRLAC